MKCNRIQLLPEDNWAFGTEFFVQLALFEVTGYGDWKISLETQTRHNQTDGEIDYDVTCQREISFSLNDVKRNTIKFRLNANCYSYQSIFRKSVEEIEKWIERLD